MNSSSHLTQYDFEECGILARQIQCALSHGNWEQAHDLVELAKKQLVREERAQDPLKMTIADTAISVRTANSLEGQLELLFVGELLETPAATIVVARNLGINAVAEIRRVIGDLGLDWAEELAETLDPIIERQRKRIAEELQEKRSGNASSED